MGRFLGHHFRTEALESRARELWKATKAGAIDSLRFHPKLKLSPAKVPFTADFYYLEHGREIWEDYKTERDPRMRDIVRLWKVWGPGILRLTSTRRGKTVIRNEIHREQKRDNGNA